MALLPSRVLPWWPHILFAIIEPLALLGGAYQASTTPSVFLFRLLTTSATSPPLPSTADLPPEVRTIAYQICNMMVLLSVTLPLIFLSFGGGARAPAVASPSSTLYHHQLIRIFLVILAVADLGHVYSSYAGTGLSPEVFWDVGRWHSMMWSEVGGSLFLCVNRLATAFGLFGRFIGADGGLDGRKRK